MKYLYQIILYLLAIFVMIALVPFIVNDYVLTAVYLLFIVAALLLKKERVDYTSLALGLVSTTLGEYFFISTGVEQFSRTTLFGVIPLWLPFLWSFIFLSIKRVFWILVKDYWGIQLK